MKKTLMAIAPLMILAGAAYADSCAELSGCAKKVCELELKLKSVSEPHAAERIKMAIAETKANCTDAKAAAHDAAKQSEHAMKVDHKIDEAKEDIAEAQMKKEHAQAEGKSDKVMKYQHKIEEKQMKIKKLEGEK